MRPTNATSEQSGSMPAHWPDVAHSSEQNEPASGGPSTHTELAHALPEVHASTPLRPVPRAPALHALAVAVAVAVEVEVEVLAAEHDSAIAAATAMAADMAIGTAERASMAA